MGAIATIVSLRYRRLMEPLMAQRLRGVRSIAAPHHSAPCSLSRSAPKRVQASLSPPNFPIRHTASSLYITGFFFSISHAVLSEAEARLLRRACDALHVPLVSDETRCGLGRCGALLCGSDAPLSVDAVVLGESLGGGYTSVASVIYDTRVFGKDNFPSTATQVNDNLSSHLGLATVAELRRRAAHIRTAAEHFERSLTQALLPYSTTASTGTDKTLCHLSGKGLLQCLHLCESSTAALSRAAEARYGTDARARWPVNLLLHVYLLKEHAVRARPGAAAVSTLLLEPPAALNDDDMCRICGALRSLLSLLRAGEYERLLVA